MPMIGAVGGGIDISRAYIARGELQAALDVAVIAGARDAGASWTLVATSVFDSSLGRDVTLRVQRSFSKPKDNRFAGTASAEVETVFSGLIGINAISISVDAAAVRVDGGATATPATSPCLYLTDETASQALLVNSGAQVTAPKCEIHARSKANPAAIFNAGSTLQTAKLCLAGTQMIDNGGTHPNLQKGCAALADPYASTWAAPTTSTCQFSSKVVSGTTVTMEPGVYCGGVNFNGSPTVTFKPGVYVLKSGDWNVNGGTWTGDGVTFWFADTSKIQFNSGVKATLSAPSTGVYKDLLIGESPGLSRSPFVLDDSKGHELKGTIHLPSRNATYNSGSITTSDSLVMVFGTLILNSMTWNFAPYQGPSPSASASSGTKIYLAK